MAIDVPVLRDDVIVLRLPAERDIEAIFEACQDPAISRFTRIPSPYNRNHAVDFVRRAPRLWRAGTDAPLMITSASDDRVLGATGLGSIARGRETAEIGYWVATDARGAGIATRATRLMSRWAVLDLGVRRLELVAHVENDGSQRVAERAGFTREGVLRAYTVMGCGTADVVMFSLLPRDLEAPVRR
jgi:RimJ/RimL family protein N-acetyltransferase